MSFTQPYRQVLFTVPQWQSLDRPTAYDVTEHTVPIAFMDSSTPPKLLNVSFAEDDIALADRVNPSYPLVDWDGNPVALS